jgi:hypothetical protein
MMSEKIPNGTIGNRNRDLPACSAVSRTLSTQQMCLFCTVGDMQTDASPMATRHREGAVFLYEMRQKADPGRGRTDVRSSLFIVDIVLKMTLFDINIKVYFDLFLSARLVSQ